MIIELFVAFADMGHHTKPLHVLFCLFVCLFVCFLPSGSGTYGNPYLQTQQTILETQHNNAKHNTVYVKHNTIYAENNNVSVSTNSSE